MCLKVGHGKRPTVCRSFKNRRHIAVLENISVAGVQIDSKGVMCLNDINGNIYRKTADSDYIKIDISITVSVKACSW